MKCIHCSSNTPGGRARTTGRCGACGHPYAFLGAADPHRVADGLFQRAIHNVSAGDTLYFTERQLWHEFLRRLPSAPRLGCAGAAALALLTPLWLLVSAGAAPGGTGTPKGPVVSFPDFQEKYLDRWIAVHGEISRLIGKEALTTAAAPPSSEVLAYSFDRALVVGSADLAAMLVANRFHFENNCAILSADRRYPAGATFDTVRQMLARNPNLVVFALHDASIDGATLAARLRADDWFPDFNTRIADIGLTPRQAWQSKIPAFVDTVPDEVPPVRLPEDEVAWLAAGNHAELAALRPSRLMKVAYHSFARVAQADDGYYDDGGIWIMGYGYGPGGYWVHDTSGPDVWAGGGALDAGAPDSFG